MEILLISITKNITTLHFWFVFCIFHVKAFSMATFKHPGDNLKLLLFTLFSSP